MSEVKKKSIDYKFIIYLFVILISGLSFFFAGRSETTSKIAVIEAIQKAENEWRDKEIKQIRTDFNEIKEDIKEIKKLVIDIIRND